MTDDFIRYGTLGGAYSITPSRIAELFEKRDIRQIDEPLELEYLNGRKEKWPRALDYISSYVELFRQWAYRRADGDKVLLQEIDGYIRDLYEWLKQGREKGQLDDIELVRLKALKEALTGKLYEYVPERLISGGQASIKQLLDDIENSEHIAKYPPRPSDKWYDAEIKRLCLLSEKLKMLMRLVEKIHPEHADKYHYLHYLGEVTGDIACYTGVLERSRDELYASIGKDKIDIEEHLSKIDGKIDDARRDIARHFSELRELLVASKPLAIHEIVRAFRQYEQSKDISTLPPIRQLYNALRKLKEPSPEDTSKLVDFIIALSRAIRSEAGYHRGLLHELSIAEVLTEIESLDNGNQQQPCEELSNDSDQAGDVKKSHGKAGQSKTNIPDYKALNLAKVPISRLIEQGESHTLEFKEIPECNTQQNRKNNDVLFPPLKTIAGFLNAEGGILLIGVDNSGKIVGIEPYLNTMEQGNNDTFEQQIRNCLRDRFEPYPIGKVKVLFEKFMEGTVCRIDVQADKEPVNLDNEVYVRDGNTTQLLKGRRLIDWIQQRRLLTALPSGK